MRASTALILFRLRASVCHPFLDAIRQIAKLDWTILPRGLSPQTVITAMKIRLLLALWLVAAAAGCRPAPEATTRPAAPPKVRGPGEGLKNVLTVTDKLISGSAPGDDADFRALRDMGVQTIV